MRQKVWETFTNTDHADGATVIGKLKVGNTEVEFVQPLIVHPNQRLVVTLTAGELMDKITVEFTDEESDAPVVVEAKK